MTDSDRIAALERQVQKLTAQLEESLRILNDAHNENFNRIAALEVRPHTQVVQEDIALLEDALKETDDRVKALEAEMKPLTTPLADILKSNNERLKALEGKPAESAQAEFYFTLKGPDIRIWMNNRGCKELTTDELRQLIGAALAVLRIMEAQESHENK